MRIRSGVIAVVVIALALLVGAGVVLADRPPATAPASAAAPSAPAWCVDDGQVVLRAAVADRIRSIRALSPGLEVDAPTVQAALMAECPLPPSLLPEWGQLSISAVEVEFP